MQGSSRPDRELLDPAALCSHLLPAGSVHAFLAVHRRQLFPDDMFEDLFPSGRGRPSVPADVMATVILLQSLEGLSDRQAVRRLETDISWKAAAGLSLADEAFDPTVLVLWRARLRNSDRPERCRCVSTTWPARGGRHVTGMIRRIWTGWSVSWSMTPTSWCGPARIWSKPGSNCRINRLTRWPCWRWWPAKTSSPATAPAAGGSPLARPRTGSS